MGLDPVRQTIEFSILRYDRNLQTLVWEMPEIFNTEWNKIHFGVFRDRVMLYVNCNQVGEQPMEYVDSRIDLNGEILIAKEADSYRTTPIDLQWMVITCDPESVERETCDELPVSITKSLEILLAPSRKLHSVSYKHSLYVYRDLYAYIIYRALVYVKLAVQAFQPEFLTNLQCWKTFGTIHDY